MASTPTSPGAFTTRRTLIAAALAGPALWALSEDPAIAASASEIDAAATEAFQRLLAANDRARQLNARALGVLIFPRIVKAGLVIGGQSGDGVMRIHGRTVGYYNISAGSFGLQAGAQTFSYVLFFITQSALDYLDRSDGWSIGSGPSVVVADRGVAGTLNTTTLTQDVYAMPFGQQGLMAGLGLEGSRIRRITPD